MATQTGTLPVGIEYAGKIHRDFELRPALVRDSIDLEEADIKGSIRAMLFLTARQLARLGEIPKEAITPELLADAYDVDLEALHLARVDLEKKLRRSSDASATSA